MERRVEEYKEPAPHEDKLRRYRLGRWVTDCRLAKGWTMVDVAMRLHANFPASRLGNQGRVSELETGNGVNRERWTPEIVRFLHGIFQPCPPPPEDPWEQTEEYQRFLRQQEAAEAKRQAELARKQSRRAPREGAAQLGLELWTEEAEPLRLPARGSRRGARVAGRS